jgi:transcriptional regulator with XRE-family HTH domain
MPPMAEEVVTGLEPRELTRQEFGRRLQNLMLARGWNQAELSRQASKQGTTIGRDSISTYINGHTFPTPLKLDALAKALGVPREQLLPNSMMQAMDAETPAIELKQAPGHPDKAWLRINRAMSFDAAAQIIAIIKADDAK